MSQFYRSRKNDDLLDLAIARFPEIVRRLGFSPASTKGTWHRARCIICCASNPETFSFHPARGVWRCWRCQRSGGVIKVIQAVHQCDAQSAWAWLEDFLGVKATPLSRAERHAWNQARREVDSLSESVDAWRREKRHQWIDRQREIRHTDRLLCGVARTALDGQISLAETDWLFLFRYGCEVHAQEEEAEKQLELLDTTAPIRVAEIFLEELKEQDKSGATL